MVSTRTVGKFRHEQTGAVVDVLCATQNREFRPMSGAKTIVQGAKSYRTATGVELNSDSADESRFVTLDGDVLIRVE